MAASKSGSPIIVDGGGSVLIDFSEEWYPPGTDADDHDHKEKAAIKTLKIKDTSKVELDLSPLIGDNPGSCWIEISHKDPGGTIRIKGRPCGIRFRGKLFKKNQKKGKPAYSNLDARITRVKIHYGRGEGKEITFDEAAIGKGKIFVDVI
jgi:hypothetical protein